MVSLEPAQTPLREHLAKMQEIVTFMADHITMDMTNAIELHRRCCEEIAAYTREDPLASMMTRPPVFNGVLDDARVYGEGWLHVRRRDDDVLEYSRVDPARVVRKMP